MDDITYYTRYKPLMIFHTSSVLNPVTICLTIYKIVHQEEPQKHNLSQVDHLLFKIFTKMDSTCTVFLFVMHLDLVLNWQYTEH